MCAINLLRRIKNRGSLQKINPLFIATSLANISWIFAWHYDFIGISVLIMVTLLILLIQIADILRTEQFVPLKNCSFGFLLVSILVGLPWQRSRISRCFSSVLVGGRFGIPDFVWTSIILLVGAVIGILRMRKDNNIAYGMVLIWAYSWILFTLVCRRF